MTDNEGNLTFWDHLDELRNRIIKIVVAIAIASIVSFCLRELLFNVILAPCHSNFFLYRIISSETFSIQLINTDLAGQMMIHLKIAICTGVLVVLPYILYVLYGFISPALYQNERKYSVKLTVSAYVMFMIGVLLNYILIFPLTVRFLGLYQVSNDVPNMLTLRSYIDTLTMMSIAFGIIFEIPVLSWLLARMGLLKYEWMIQYRRHAIVAILIIAAIITPTSDIFTLCIVSLPIWLLYEVSILIVRNNSKQIQ